MAKAVLIIDMPEDCTMCKFWNSKDTSVMQLALKSFH